MKMHDELRERLRRGAEVPVGSPELDRIQRRAGARRARRVIGTVVASALVAVAVVVPLVALTAVGGRDPVVQRPGDGESASSAPSSVQVPDPTQNVLFYANCELPDGRKLGSMLARTLGDPVDLCANVWLTGDASGFVWEMRPKNADPGPHTSVPPMVECATYGAIEVRLSDDPDYCGANGMWAIPDGYMDTVMRWDATHSAFAGRVFPETDGSCTDPQTAIRVVREELEAHGFTAWTVEDHFDANSSNGQCAAYSSNFKDMQVIIVNDSVS